MKSSDILIILLFIIIFAIPLPTPTPNVTSVNMVLAEGAVAIAFNDIDKNAPAPKPTPKPTPDESKCKCDGTGYVRSPDNVTNIKCPCDNCRCESKEPPTPPANQGCGCGNPNCNCTGPMSCNPKGAGCSKNQVLDASPVVNTVHILKRQMLYFHAKWCIPCVKFDKEQAPELKRLNWGVDEKRLSYIKKLDFDKYPELAQKFNVEAIPTFILLENGVEIDRMTGYFTAGEVTQLWTKHFK